MFGLVEVVEPLGDLLDHVVDEVTRGRLIALSHGRFGFFLSPDLVVIPARAVLKHLPSVPTNLRGPSRPWTMLGWSMVRSSSAWM